MTRRRTGPEALLARSGLGPEAAAAVRATVRATGLWRRENADVCRELIAHFLDGREAGVDEAALVRDFGDPRAAARLIGRAKRRQRPLAWHAAMWGVRGVAGVFALAICLYGVLAWRYYSATPVIRRDYVAEINAAAAAVPESERAWPVYRGAMTRLKPMFGRDGVWENISSAEPHWPRWPEMRRAIEERQEEIAALRKASEMSSLGWVASASFDPDDAALFGPDPRGARRSSSGMMLVVEVLLPHLNWLKKSAALLSADARVAALAGDGARAAADIEAMLGVSRHVREIRLLISDLVAASILQKAAQTAAWCVHNAPSSLSDRDLRVLAHALSAAPTRLSVASERVAFDDFLQRVYSDDGNGGGAATAEGLRLWEKMSEDGGAASAARGNRSLDVLEAALGPLTVAAWAGRSEMAAAAERLYAAAQADADAPVILAGKGRIDAEMEALQRTPLGSARYALLLQIFPNWKESFRAMHETAMHLDGAMVALVMESFRRLHGRLPVSLEELVPEHLPSVPRDRYDGRPLRMTEIDGVLTVYSIGRNLSDDVASSASDDLILYPPRPRKPPAPPVDDEDSEPVERPIEAGPTPR